MLDIYDISGMFKRAQDTSFFGMTSSQSTPTLADLVRELQADRGLTDNERRKLMMQMQGIVGNSPLSTPLSALMYKGLGGILGYLISKYFGMGVVGRLLSAAAGFGLGKALYGKLNTPPDPYKGYRILR